MYYRIRSECTPPTSYEHLFGTYVGGVWTTYDGTILPGSMVPSWT